MTEVLAWAWTPLVLYAVVLGVGLLADRVVGARLPGALLAPLGMALAIVLLIAVYRLELSDVVATPLLVIVAVAGFVFGREGLGQRLLDPAALISAGLVYLLYIAPVVLSGHATWAGYNFVNDTSVNFILIDLLEHHGAVGLTGESIAVRSTSSLLDVGYPLGSFSLVAAIRPLTGAPLEAIYQPVISLFAALAAMSITEIARRSGLRTASAVVAGTLPMGGVLLYRYALHGGIKEVALVALCATAVALALVAIERRLAITQVALVSAVCLAMVLAFSAAAGVYALSLAAAGLGLVAFSPNRPSSRQIGRLVAVAVGVGLIVLLPTLGATLDFAGTLRQVFSASNGDPTGMFGQLLRPLPISEAAGVWVSRDYRLEADSPLNAPLVAAAIAVTVAGVVVALHRRKYAPLVLLVATAVPAAVISPLSSPYIDAKLLVVVTPAVVFLAAFAALSGLQSPSFRLRGIGAVALLVVGGGVVASDVYSYRETRLPPAERVAAMKDVAAHVPGRGLYLLNEWEEFGKYFMRAAPVNPASEPQSLRRVKLRADAGLSPLSPQRAQKFGRWFDLDEQLLGYIERFHGIITRRSPDASRPPANFHMFYRNSYYELWRRNRAARVVAHLPLQKGDRAARIPDCADVRALARRARPGERLLAAEPPRVARLTPALSHRPPGWPAADEPLGAVTPNGPGRVTGALTAHGPVRVWLKASGGRPLRVSVDGRQIGTTQEIATPGQWQEVGAVRLSRGSHEVEISRRGASWRPGDSYRGYVGPVALQSVEPRRLRSLAPREAGRLCGRSWDWIELVRGRP